MEQELPGREEEPEASFGERVRSAAREAEVLTGYHEQTEQEISQSLAIRLSRTIAGFVLVALGIVALPLPGPGWLIIIVGLSLLPYAWAERTVRLIRRRIPGIPEEGRIGVRQWVVMGALVAAAVTGSLLWGDDVTSWAGDTWSSAMR
jgi:uncharacterized protein (TIGR02611 family)